MPNTYSLAQILNIATNNSVVVVCGNVPLAATVAAMPAPSKAVLAELALLQTKSSAFARAFAGGQSNYYGAGLCLVTSRYLNLELYLCENVA